MSSGKNVTITWQEAMAASIMLVDFHLIHIKKMLENESIKKEVSQENFKEAGAPLHLAAACGRAEIVQLLIDAGANVDAYASGLGSWMTPLHHAALNNQVEAAKVLIENGANYEERGFQDALKGTPLDFARHAKHEEMIKYLSSMEGTGKSKTGYSSTTHPEMQNGAFKRRTSVGSAASGGRGSNKGREQSLPPGGRRL